MDSHSPERFPAAIHGGLDKLLDNTTYTGWDLIVALVDGGTGEVLGAVVAAPPEQEIGDPYAFVIRRGDQVNILRNSDLLALGIGIAHWWNSTDILDGVSEESIAEMLTAFSFPRISPQRLAYTLDYASRAFAARMLGNELHRDGSSAPSEVQS